VGDRPGKVYPASPGTVVEQNLRNYRITDADKIGSGSLKQKFRENVAAIETLHRVEAERREATVEEKAALVRYVGWGGIPQVFAAVPPDEWRQESEALRKLLSKDEMESARASTLNAHYTAPEVIRAMYAGLERLGFEGGRILEPACGLGHFFGLMPEKLRRNSSITGIELDSLTARISQKLYPDADIRHSPFETAKLADAFYDVAISNVPFGDYQPYDKRFNAYKFPIHDYFFAASLERIRPGGIVFFITSKGTLDKKSAYLRKHLSKQADLVAAVRLPNTAFRENANTEVTTDIVILQKRLPGQTPSGLAWQETVPYTNHHGEEMFINEYFVRNPRQMLGKMELKGTMYRLNEPALVSDGRDLTLALTDALARLPERVYEGQTQTVSVPSDVLSVHAPDDIKPNGYALIETDQGNMVAVRDGDELVTRPDLSGDASRRIRALIKVRSAVRECLRAQVENKPESEILGTRRQLNAEYDQFYSRFGPISERANTRAFAGDPDLPLLLSLESFNEETRVATKTAIFRERTIQYQKPAESAQTAREALLISLNENGKVDLPHMSWLLKKPAQEIILELKGAIFLNPQSQNWETEDAYLSGNIREKLAVAEAATITDARYQENVEALKSVLPEELKATEIDARLGSAWIPESDIEKFAHELLNLTSSESASSPPSSPVRVMDPTGRLQCQEFCRQYHRMGYASLQRYRPHGGRLESADTDRLRHGPQIRSEDYQRLGHGSRSREAAANQGTVWAVDLAGRRAPPAPRREIQRGIQQHTSPHFRRNPSFFAGSQSDYHP
jgi:predicted O-methyltransferase YrrM